jgi:DNA-binding transcriptional MerR regulator
VRYKGILQAGGKDMIKIKEFAGLCQCTTQTLRYYDQIELLSPAYVDEENNYRYYQASQLFDYIKIKNLQLADFSIAEIKHLLNLSDRDIYFAIDQKIKKLQERLANTLKIKEAYHIESRTMEKLLRFIKEQFKETFQPESAKQEFHLSDAELNTYVEEWETMFLSVLSNNEQSARLTGSGLMEEQIMQAMEQFKTAGYKTDDAFNPDDYAVLKAFHGWDYLHEVMADICDVNDGDRIIYYLEVTREKIDLAYALPTILLQTVLRNNPKKSLQLECEIRTSPDCSNHIYILDKERQL